MRGGLPTTAKVLLATGTLLLALGIALVSLRFGPPGLMVVDSAPVEFGWFAYADGGPGPLYVVTRREVGAFAIGALGLALVAAGVGYARGARRGAGSLAGPG